MSRSNILTGVLFAVAWALGLGVLSLSIPVLQAVSQEQDPASPYPTQECHIVVVKPGVEATCYNPDGEVRWIMDANCRLVFEDSYAICQEEPAEEPTEEPFQIFLVNGNTGEAITVTSGQTFPYQDGLTLIVEPGIEVDKVRFVGHRTESQAPYALCGDSGGSYFLPCLDAGTHNIGIEAVLDGEVVREYQLVFTLEEGDHD